MEIQLKNYPEYKVVPCDSFTIINGIVETVAIRHIGIPGHCSKMYLFHPFNTCLVFAFPNYTLYNAFRLKYRSNHTDKFWLKVWCPIYDYVSVSKLVIYEINTRVQLSRQLCIV